MLNSKTTTKTVNGVTMKTTYQEWFNNHTGDVNCKLFILFEVNGYAVASASRYNENKLIPFGDNAEKYLNLFNVLTK